MVEATLRVLAPLDRHVERNAISADFCSSVNGLRRFVNAKAGGHSLAISEDVDAEKEKALVELPNRP